VIFINDKYFKILTRDFRSCKPSKRVLESPGFVHWRFDSIYRRGRVMDALEQALKDTEIVLHPVDP
jgi:hypothetical protein